MDKRRMGQVALGILGAGVLYATCFMPRTVREAKVVGIERYIINDPLEGYYEEQLAVRLDKHQRCLRSPLPFGEDLKPGDRLEYMKWRPGDDCDFATSYKKEGSSYSMDKCVFSWKKKEI